MQDSPSNKNSNGAARRISVKLGKSGFHLAYRRTYIAGEKDTAEKEDAQQALDRMEAVMQCRAPTEHEILFTRTPEWWFVDSRSGSR